MLVMGINNHHYSTDEWHKANSCKKAKKGGQ
jgi:hypothetical protein